MKMSQLIIVTVLLSLMMVHVTGLYKKHATHRFRGVTDYEAKGSVPRYLPMRTLDQKHIWNNEMYENHENATRTPLKFKRRDTISDLQKELNELDINNAQNDSLCDYVVKPIPSINDIDGNWILKDLKHIKCKHRGNNCYGEGTHCCIQTYTHIKIRYSNADERHMKIFTGCVCAHRWIPSLTKSFPLE